MRTIYKYPLTGASIQEIKFKAVGVKILCIQLQNGVPTLWVECVPNISFNETKRIYTFGTGWPIPDNLNIEYIGTFQTSGGLVFHAYNEINP